MSHRSIPPEVLRRSRDEDVAEQFQPGTERLSRGAACARITELVAVELDHLARESIAELVWIKTQQASVHTLADSTPERHRLDSRAQGRAASTRLSSRAASAATTARP